MSELAANVEFLSLQRSASTGSQDLNPYKLQTPAFIMEGGQDTWFAPLAAEQASKFANALHLV